MSDRGYFATRYHGSVSSGQEGDISDASVGSDLSGGDLQQSADDVKGLQAETERQEKGGFELARSLQGRWCAWGLQVPKLRSGADALHPEGRMVDADTMPRQEGSAESHRGEGEGSSGEGSPNSPLSERIPDQLEKSSSQSPGYKPSPDAPSLRLLKTSDAQQNSQDAEERRSADEASSGEESTSQLLVLKGWQSPQTATKAKHSENQEGEVQNLQRTLAAAQANARRWKAAATASDSQARGFQVALAATEQTMQALNNRHVGEFAAAWERIREMEKRMSETVQEHALQLAAFQAELAEKQRLIDASKDEDERANKTDQETFIRLEAENRALENALINARSELERARASEDRHGVIDSRVRQLEDELAKAQEREVKKDTEMQAKLAEAEEAIEASKQQMRDALQQAEERWQEILAKRDANRVEELQAKEQENRELLEVVEDRLREISMLQQEVSDLQESVSEMDWMKERMAGFEREVIQEVSDLSKALDAKEEVIDNLQAALKSAREALVLAETDLQAEEKKHRGKAAEKAREFASELSDVENLYRLELQKKEGQMQGLEAELKAAQDSCAEQKELVERRQEELLEERRRHEERVAKVSVEIDALRARIVGAESTGKIAAALVAELEESQMECDSLREKLTCQQLEHVEVGQQVSDLQQQVHLERDAFAALELGLRNSLHSVESDLSKVECQKQGLEETLRAVSEELGVTEGPAKLVVVIRSLREETERSKRALSDAVSEAERLKEVEEQVMAKNERMKELRNALSEAKQELIDLQGKRDTEGESFANRVSEALEQARLAREAKDSLEKECAEEIERQEKLQDELEKALSECERELQVEQSLRKAAEERNTEVHTMLAVLEVKEAEQEKLEHDVSELRLRIEEHEFVGVEAQSTVEALKGEVERLKSQLADSEARQLEAREKVAMLEGELKEENETLSKLTASLEALGAEHRKALQLVESTRNESEKVTSNLGRVEAQLERKEDELASARRSRDERGQEVERLTAELEAERKKGERQSEEMKRHVEAAADEYRRARVAVKAELDRVNGVMEQERITASPALRDAKQSQHDAEDRCKSLERELRTIEETLSLRTSDLLQLREQAIRDEREFKSAQRRMVELEGDVESFKAESEKLKESLQETETDLEKLRKAVKAREKAVVGLEEKVRRAESESGASAKRVTLSNKEADREKRSKKESMRKAELANAAAEKSAREKEVAERAFADALKKLETEQNSKEQLQREFKNHERERQKLESALKAAKGESSPLQLRLEEAESILATCQKEKQGLEDELAASERERLEILETQAAAQREKEEALVGLQEALDMVEAAVNAKEKAVKELEIAERALVAEKEPTVEELEGWKRSAAEARERAIRATQETQTALAEKRAAIQEKETIIETVEEVLASIEQERTDLFAMAKAAAAELAHEMRKVKQLQSSLQRHSLEEPLPLEAPAWPKGLLVKQYLASDLALRTKAGKLASGDWVLEEETLLLEDKEGALWKEEKKSARKVDQGTNTESFVIESVPLVAPRQLVESGVQTDDALGRKESEALILKQRVEELQRLLAAKEQDLESVCAGISTLENELLASRGALELVEKRNKLLDAEKSAQVARIELLRAALVQASQDIEGGCGRLESAHVDRIDALEAKLSCLQQRLESATQELSNQQVRSEEVDRSDTQLPVNRSLFAARLRPLEEKQAADEVALDGRALAKKRTEKLGAAFTKQQVLLLQVLFLSGQISGGKEALCSAEKESNEAGVNTDHDVSILSQEGLLRAEEAASESAEDSRKFTTTSSEELEGKMKLLEEKVLLREEEIARLQKDSKQVLRLVEEKEEEIERLQRQLNDSKRQLSDWKAKGSSGQNRLGEGVQVDGTNSPHETGLQEHVSSEFEDDVFEMDSEEAKEEITRLREVLKISIEEKQAAEAELIKGFANDLQTAAEKYGNVRSEFANRVEELENAGKEMQTNLDLEQLEFERKCEELLRVQTQYQEAMQLAKQMQNRCVKAERGREEMCAELERAVVRLRDQQELLEVLQQRVRAAETPKGPLEKEDELEGDGSGSRVAALDQVIEMWREACKQKDVEISTLRSALATTQSLLTDAEARLGQLRTDFQRLDMANEDTCSELDRRIAEMAIAAKQLADALQSADHRTVEVRADGELADEGQLAQIAMAAAAVIAREARELNRMQEKVEILQRMQVTPENLKASARVEPSGETYVRTPARKPAWLNPEHGVV